MSIIGKSTNTSINSSTKLYAFETISESITDGVATISNGTIKNLIDGTDGSDAVPKSFVDGQGTIAQPNHSVQFNDTVFAGSESILYDGTTLNVDGDIVDSSGILITGGSITGLSPPIGNSDIATKGYVDGMNSSSVTHIEIDSDVDLVYSPLQMINAFILRNIATYGTSDIDNFGVNLTDTTASASDIIGSIPNVSVGQTFTFRIMNENKYADGIIESRDRFELTLLPGEGVTFYPNIPIVLHRGYLLDSYLVVDDIDTPSVRLIVNVCCYSDINLQCAPDPVYDIPIFSNKTDFFNFGSTIVSGLFLFDNKENYSSDLNYEFRDDDIKNRLIVRNPTSNSIDMFGNILNPFYLNQIMVVKNVSEHVITIVGQSDLWNLIPSNIVVPPKKSVHLSITTNAITNIQNGGNYYANGKSGGNRVLYEVTGSSSGEGMMVYAKSIITVFDITSGGSGYYLDPVALSGTIPLETINTTNPGATGLVINATIDDSIGQIVGIDNIILMIDGGYNIGDVLQIVGGNNDAYCSITSLNSINELRLVDFGNGEYTSSEYLTLSGDSGVGAEIILGTLVNVVSLGVYSI